MLKRITALIMTAVMLLACFTACGEKPTDTGADAQAQEQTAKVYGMLPEVDPEDYRGTKIVVALETDPFNSRAPTTLLGFREKYGIDFDYVRTNGKTAGDIETMLAADKQIDVIFDRKLFPSSLSILQPLDAAKLDLSLPLWNKTLINASTVNGKSYLIDSVSGLAAEYGLCVFNKKLFDKAGLEYPSELYKKGEWTMDAFKNAAKKISALGKEYSGAGAHDETMLAIFACRVFDFKDGKVSVSVDERYKKVLTEMAQMRVDGYLKLDRFGFDDGRQGLCITDSNGLRTMGYYTHINPDFVGATYLPVYKKGDPVPYTAPHIGYGLVKGAKNPVAAGIYISYCLNPENTKKETENAFHNKEVEEFYAEMCANIPDNVLYQYGSSVGMATGGEEHLGYCFMDTEPEDITPYIDSMLPALNQMAEELNSKIKESS